MSTDRAHARKRSSRWLRRLTIAFIVIIVTLALAIWLAFPWGPIKGLRVERAEVIAKPRTAGKLPAGAEPRQIVVTFSLPKDADGMRQDKGANFINASLSACEDADIDQVLGVAPANGGYFRDDRVEALPSTGSGADRRYLYRATFDDWIAIPRGPISESVSPIDVGGGPCFSLGGGSMWMGKLWSDRIPLKLVDTTEGTAR